MLIILAPAKTFHTIPSCQLKPYEPLVFHKETQEILEILKSYDAEALAKWMKMSKELGEVNVERFQSFESREAKGGVAIDYLNGEAYKGLDAQSLSTEARKYLHKHLMILSGFYGCIHTEDYIQPYRLEMGTKFQHSNIKSLYTYWKEKLTDYILEKLEEDKDEQILIDLASTEYSKALDMKKIRKQYPVVTVSFKEEVEDGKYKVIGMYAKKARGMMVRYMAEQEIANLETLKKYAQEGYRYREDLSDNQNFIFTRKREEEEEGR